MIETPRLLLRPLRDEDVEPFWEIQDDRDAMRFTYAAPSRDECGRRLHEHERLRAEHGFAPWVVTLRAEGCVVGWGGLGVDPFAPGWGPEVSYFLHPAQWGRGLATEVVRASVAHGFETLALPAIGAFARPDNAASIRVLEKFAASASSAGSRLSSGTTTRSGAPRLARPGDPAKRAQEASTWRAGSPRSRRTSTASPPSPISTASR